jgi:hypothetical protein
VETAVEFEGSLRPVERTLAEGDIIFERQFDLVCERISGDFS